MDSPTTTPQHSCSIPANHSLTNSPLIYKNLSEAVDTLYPESDRPCLSELIREGQATRPFSGLKILDASPVFRNTLVKYHALLTAGADLAIPLIPGLIYDPDVIELLRAHPSWSIRLVEAKDLDNEQPDIILDCAGILSSLRPRYGAIELTRSGARHYENAPYPVILADSGRVKLLETILGTGDGLLRALLHLGYRTWTNEPALVFGGGKVGLGIAYALHKAGAIVTLADLPDRITSLSTNYPDFRFISVFDQAELAQSALHSKLIVTATGRAQAMDGLLPAEDIIARTNILLANMGVEDEWGPTYPAERVLNGKMPLNFILEEPTHMRFIDATMALHNACINELIPHTNTHIHAHADTHTARSAYPNGLSLPPDELDRHFLDLSLTGGRLGLPTELAPLLDAFL